ncbi:DNA primase TraC [Vibrio jasicida]|uniref:ArdC family protein n=1 Tax=Vibrio jasicida TaxID=766224 RepID=UPI0028952233|nr:DNA primase TraC [Vibrio jasicida]
MTDSNVIRSTITKQPKPTKFSNLESKAASKDGGCGRKISKKRRVKKVAKDMYQVVTDKVIAALEKGVKPWVCPWDRTGDYSMFPVNFKTKSVYSGINILLLWSETAEKGFSSPFWLTFKQAQELGGNVIKGQKGTTIIYYKMWEKENEEGEKESIPMLKTFVVFNLDQIENIDKPTFEMTSQREEKEFTVLEHVEEAIDKTGVTIVYSGARAFYSPSADQITLPEKTRFHSSSDYYATAFHELVHSTGHGSRLNRDLKNSFGSKDYAFEELVAELGAAFCCADFGVVGDVQHESYVAGWLSKLYDDKRFIFKAASLASKAHQYLVS